MSNLYVRTVLLSILPAGLLIMILAFAAGFFPGFPKFGLASPDIAFVCIAGIIISLCGLILHCLYALEKESRRLRRQYNLTRDVYDC